MWRIIGLMVRIIFGLISAEKGSSRLNSLFPTSLIRVWKIAVNQRKSELMWSKFDISLNFDVAASM